MSRTTTATRLALLALAVAWTWPAAPVALGLVDPRVPASGFDALGTVWTLGRAPELLLGLHDPSTAWPAGGDYHRLDSWLLLPFGAAWQLVGGRDAATAARAYSALILLAPLVNALSAEAVARRLGAAAPASLLAALAWGFNGHVATMLGEGHAYIALNPWAPWLVVAVPRALARGTATAGAAVGLLAAGCLATSAYALLLGALVGAAMSTSGPVDPRGLARAGAGFLLGFGPAAALWAVAFAGAATFAERVAEPYDVLVHTAAASSATLEGFGPPTPELDRTTFGHAYTLPATALALALAAPRVLRADHRPLALLGVVAFVLSLGPTLFVGDLALPLPWRVALAIPGAGFIRFPARIGGLVSLAAGLLGARVLASLDGRRWVVTALLGCALVDTFGWVGLPRRLGTQSADTPSAYGHGGSILDLWPLAPRRDPQLAAWTRGWSCLAQLDHHRPIADHCQATDDDTNPRVAVSLPVLDAAMRGDALAARAALVGWSAVAVHVDRFDPDDAARVLDTLGVLAAERRESHDGGEHLVVLELAP